MSIELSCYANYTLHTELDISTLPVAVCLPVRVALCYKSKYVFYIENHMFSLLLLDNELQQK